MKILVTGRGSSGSWEIRGVQLGRAVGAEVRKWRIDSSPLPELYEVVVWVKRWYPAALTSIKRAGSVLVWDFVDAWPQPEGNHWREEQARKWLAAELERVRPDFLVAPTRRFAEDVAKWGLFDAAKVRVVYHHAWPKHTQAPIRAQIQTIAYEGGQGYIHEWGRAIGRIAERRGLRFLVNPENMHDADVVVAVRDHVGYAPRHWKSNVKLANAHALGLPVIAARECGYAETATGFESWADSPAELSRALDVLAPVQSRAIISRQFTDKALRVDAVARSYAEWLRGIF